MNAPDFPYIGQPLKRREDFKFLTGRGRYVDDIKLPGMLHVAIARSPHAHAVITSVDLSSAKAAPGVRLVLAGKDLDGKIGPIVPNSCAATSCKGYLRSQIGWTSTPGKRFWRSSRK